MREGLSIAQAGAQSPANVRLGAAIAARAASSFDPACILYFGGPE
jgi:hypothetical protein